MKTIYLLAILIVLASCNTYSDDQINEFDSQITSYLEDNKIKCQRSPSGLHYKIIEEGNGELIKFTNIV